MSEMEKAEAELFWALSRLASGEGLQGEEIMGPLEDYIDAKIAAALSPSREDEGK